jgi:hypothetical protein
MYDLSESERSLTTNQWLILLACVYASVMWALLHWLFFAPFYRQLFKSKPHE